MALFEASKYDPTDYVFNPMWRQGMYVLPFMASPRRNNLLVRMVSYRYRCNVQPLDYRRRSCLMATGWTHPLHLRPVDWNVTFALVG